ncbi:MAG: hypothetical protein HY934_00705 [Candidatus Firestonebacteria bacterium]|nr:hypothetical protein [Candidatus Firestonebacteria bacterium]
MNKGHHSAANRHKTKSVSKYSHHLRKDEKFSSYYKRKAYSDLLHLIGSIAIHIILFFVINVLPHKIDSLPWKQTKIFNQNLKKKAGRNIEIINLTSSAEIKNKKKKEKTETEKNNKLKFLNLTKSKPTKEQEEKKPIINQQLVQEKFVEEKLIRNINEIKNKSTPKSATFLPPTRIERGIRSISEKSPLMSHLMKKEIEPIIQDIEKQPLIADPAKKILDLKNPEKEIKEKIVKKELDSQFKKFDEKKIKIEKPDLIATNSGTLIPGQGKNIQTINKEINIKQISQKETFEKIVIDEPKLISDEKAIKINESIADEKIAKAVYKNIEKKAEQKPLEKINKADIQKDKAITRDNVLKQRVDSKLSLKSETKNIKASLPQKTINNEPINESNANDNKLVEKEQFNPVYEPNSEDNQLTTAEPNNPFYKLIAFDEDEKHITDYSISENKIPTSSDKQLNKNINLKSSEKIKQAEIQKDKIVTRDNVLKQRVDSKLSLKSETKNIKASLPQKAAAVYEENIVVSDFKKEISTNIKPTSTEQIVKKNISIADIKKVSKETNRELFKDKEDKKNIKIAYETTYKTREAMPVLAYNIEEPIENEKIKKILTKDKNKKNEVVEAKKLERKIDRNPVNTSKSKTVPLTMISRGGQISVNTTEKYTYDEMKKIDQQIKNISNKEQIFFSPNVKRSDIKTILDKKEIEKNTAEKSKTEKKQETITPDKQIVLTKEAIAQTESKPNIISEAKTIEAKAIEKKDISEQIKNKEIIKKDTFEKLPEGLKIHKGMEAAKTTESEIRKAKSPNILLVTHNATRTLGKGDELEVVLEGDPGNIAFFDIGLFRSKIPLNEVSPGIYRGSYRVIEGDNVTNAPVAGYLTNKDFNQSFMMASKVVSIDTNPGITIASPASPTVSTPKQSISGIIDDVKVRNVIISVDGKTRIVEVENGYFNVDLDLKEGKNVIMVKCEDSKGVVRTDRVELNYNPFKEAVPKVNIIYPPDGEVVNLITNPIIKIRGTVTDPTITKAKLISNNIATDIIVENGEFSHEVMLQAETNSYVVQVTNSEGKIGLSEPITIKTIGLKNYDAIITLNWDIPDTDIDLVLKSPSGKSISRKARSYDIPGAKLQLYSRKGSVGQEVITLRQATAGLYVLQINNHDYNLKKYINASLVVTFADPKDPNKMNLKTFGPKSMSAGDGWEISFVCIPDTASAR